MIRVEITKTQWRTPGGDLAFFEPVLEDGDEYTKECQVLLVQEFNDLRIEPIVALLNRLQETPLCTCNHSDTKHEGGTGACSARLQDVPAYSVRCCGCKKFMTWAQTDAQTVLTAAAKFQAQLERSESEVTGLKAQVATLTRSRDGLRRRSKKSGAKRR
ncbi:hypothetical protein LCGC14_0898470 [marine sediment metagenome]|uniref:Uncharacterized protein n=1 Tax=marine sediment metagenome TaxID=412755 RepID=A0A0F9RG68_9ZZZZ